MSDVSVVLFQDVHDSSASYTVDELRATSTRFGRGIQNAFEVRKGCVVALIASNHYDLPAIIFGVLACGATVSPINPTFTLTEFEHQLKDCRAEILLVDINSLPIALRAWQKLGHSPDKVLLVGDSSNTHTKFRSWKDFCYPFDGPVPILYDSPDPKNDVAFLVYSSGTTGKPKGVMLTHHNITANTEQTQSFETITWDGSLSVPGFPDAKHGVGDKILACLPYFHIYGLTAMMINPVYTGVCAVVGSNVNLEKWCSWVQKHRITIGYIVPPLVVQLAKDPIVDQYDLSSLRITTCGAAPLTREVVLKVFQRLGMRIKQGYGLSEAAPTLFTMKWADWDKKSGSAGRLIPNVLAKICAVPDEDETNISLQEVPYGTPGELYVQGPNIFKGYLQNSAATKAAFIDGWFRTGDVGYIDKDGDLFITDRAKELIKYKGFQVAPAELEGLLLDNDLIEDVAVIGLQRPDLGTEVPRAYVVRRGGPAARRVDDEKTIVDWLASRVVSYKRLRGGVKFVEEIPKNGSGKILRRLLRSDAAADSRAKL
jgi:4-coumarate--CoA ligase